MILTWKKIIDSDEYGKLGEAVFCKRARFEDHCLYTTNLITKRIINISDILTPHNELSEAAVKALTSIELATWEESFVNREHLQMSPKKMITIVESTIDSKTILEETYEEVKELLDKTVLNIISSSRIKTENKINDKIKLVETKYDTVFKMFKFKIANKFKKTIDDQLLATAIHDGRFKEFIKNEFASKQGLFERDIKAGVVLITEFLDKEY